ncbi:hypothetical protein XRIDKHHW_0051 [Klebsiella phage Whistle]|uniref:Uncharacterized protein n=1 Tax=Klebsiella phage Whistle TaxID=3018531 RepID=A0AAF0D843_9CAUD|nr:hypothetical protein XRIDKHHW_0051 [Klebsiella phage Whistle]
MILCSSHGKEAIKVREEHVESLVLSAYYVDSDA